MTVTSLTPQAAGLSGWGGGHLHPERLDPLPDTLDWSSGHSGQPFCLSKAFPSAVKTPQVSSIRTRNSSWTPHSPVSWTGLPLTLYPAPAQLLPQLLEPPPSPTRPGSSWRAPLLSVDSDAVPALTCWILGPGSSRPTLPLAASARVTHPWFPSQPR